MDFPDRKAPASVGTLENTVPHLRRRAMNRLIMCLTVVITLSLVVESASAARGRRIRRVHQAAHHAVRPNHVIHRAPVVHRHVTRVVPSRYLQLQHSYRPTHVIPSYRQGVVHQFGHSGGITISGRVFSLHIGF